jgi:hypothetical protein
MDTPMRRLACPPAKLNQGTRMPNVLERTTRRSDVDADAAVALLTLGQTGSVLDDSL